MTATTAAASAPTFQAANRAHWREWLRDNGQTADGVWLVIAPVVLPAK